MKIAKIEAERAAIESHGLQVYEVRYAGNVAKHNVESDIHMHSY